MLLSFCKTCAQGNVDEGRRRTEFRREKMEEDKERERRADGGLLDLHVGRLTERLSMRRFTVSTS